MTAPHRVQIIGEGADARLQRAVLATVPNSFELVDRNAAVLHISGRDGSVAAGLEAVGERTRAIVLTSPSFLDAYERAELGKAASARGARIKIGLAYAPWFDGENGGVVSGNAGDTAILDINASVAMATAGELREALLEQLVVARLLMGSVARLDLLQAGPDAVTVEAAGGTPTLRWRMTARAGRRNGLVVDRVSPDRRMRVTIDAEPLGAPARIAIFDATGSHMAMPVFQGGDRASWLSLATMLERSDPAPDAMALLEEDLGLLPF